MSSDFVPALRFRALTRFYDPVVRWTTRERRVKEALIAAAEVPADATILDVGCGTGTMTMWIKQQFPGARVLGIDLDPAILGMARDKAAKSGVDVEFIEANAADMPLPAGSVDCVFSSLFFHHLLPEQKVEVLGEIFRVLKDGGEVHISDWGRPANKLMRGAFYFVQLLDGFATTEDSVRGRLIDYLGRVGARNHRECQRFNTMLGTLRLVRAKK